MRTLWQEYLKVFTAFSDMTRLPQDDPNRLTHGVDYELATQIGGTTTLNIIARLAIQQIQTCMQEYRDNPLFPNDLSFQHALKKDAPVFMMRERVREVYSRNL